MNSAPDWEGYRVFLAVAERGSFSNAARELGISQPTASRAIDALERALGTRLLVRRSRGVLPTPAGDRVLASARQMAVAAYTATRAGGAAVVERRIRISATEGLGTIWLPYRLGELTSDARLHVDLVIDNASDLAARQADIAIRLFKPRQPDLVAKKVGTLGFGFFASPRYLRERGTPRRLDDLSRHDHVGYLDRGTLPSYMRWLRDLVPTERFVANASSLLAMHELARVDRGIVLGTQALVMRSSSACYPCGTAQHGQLARRARRCSPRSRRPRGARRARRDLRTRGHVTRVTIGRFRGTRTE